jgi:hypothetical protein
MHLNRVFYLAQCLPKHKPVGQSFQLNWPHLRSIILQRFHST